MCKNYMPQHFGKVWKICTQLHIPVLCSKHQLCSESFAEPGLWAGSLSSFTGVPAWCLQWPYLLSEQNARCCQCQGTAAEQSCEPCPWSWMIFFTWLKWSKNSKEILLGIKMCQKGKHVFAVMLIRLFCCNDFCFVLQSVGHEWVLTSP